MGKGIYVTGEYACHLIYGEGTTWDRGICMSPDLWEREYMGQGNMHTMHRVEGHVSAI